MSQPGTNPAPGGSNTGGRNHNIITFGQQDIWRGRKEIYIISIIVRNNYSWVMMIIRWWLEEGQRRYKTSPEKSLLPEPYAAHRCHLQGDFHLWTLQRGFSHWKDDDFCSWDIEKLFLQLLSANKQKCPSRRYCSFCNHPPATYRSEVCRKKNIRNTLTQIVSED